MYNTCMKVYKFIFFVGLSNLVIPFLGISFIYKQYIMVAIATITVVYALIVRAVAKEKEHFRKQETSQNNSQTHTYTEPRTIEDVVEMQEEHVTQPISEVKNITRKPRKSKILIKSNLDL
jgi:membrane protein implicated in regulation of membrane protease activity